MISEQNRKQRVQNKAKTAAGRFPDGALATLPSPLAALNAQLPLLGFQSALLLLLALLLALLAYQPRFHSSASLADEPTNIRIQGAYPVEGTGAAAQRWTAPRSSLRFAGVGAGGYTLLLRFHGGAAPGAGRLLTVRAGQRDRQQPLALLPLRPDWQELRLAIPPAAVNPENGDLLISLEVPSLRGAPGDPRPLGLALHSVALQPLTAGPGWALPPPAWRVTQLALALLLIFWSLLAVGMVARGALALAALVAAALAAGLATARVDTVLLLDVATLVLPGTLALALALGVWRVARRPRASTHGSITALHCAVLLIFTLRLGGLLHPQYILIDQRLRANQLMAIAAGQVALVRPQLEQQYEWGTREPVPYSLLTYYMLLPLTWLWRDRALVTAVEATSVLLDATVPLLLAALIGQSYRSGALPGTGVRSTQQPPAPELTAAFAGLCYAAFPVGYLFFHDGSFPTTIGLWIVLLALIALGQLAPTAAQSEFPLSRILLPAAFLAVALVAYVTHIAFVGFLVLALVGGVGWLGGHWRAARQIAAAGALALLADWLIYYRSYTLTLVQRTIPAFVEQIVEQGAVGRDAALLYNTANNSFAEHLQAHFRTWPVLLAATALLLLLLRYRGSFVTHIGLAYGLFFVATTFAERWFGLWNKHIYFAAPGVALLAGVALAWLWRRGLPGQLVCVTLLAALFWQSTIAWGNRSLWYMLPASAL